MNNPRKSYYSSFSTAIAVALIASTTLVFAVLVEAVLRMESFL